MSAPQDFRLDQWDGADDDDEGSVELPAFLADPIGVVRRRWLWILLAGVAGLVMTGLLVLSWKPTYEASATVLVTSQQIPEDFVRSTVQHDSVANIETMLGGMLSQENLTALIEQHDLYPKQRRTRPAIELVGELRSHVTAGPIGGRPRGYTPSIIYGLTFEYDVPAKAADVANSLAALLMEASIARRNQQARSATEFLRQALASDEQELREQSSRVSAFRRAHRGELPGELDTSLRKLDMAAQRRESLAGQIAALENRLATLASDPGTVAESENELLLQELRRQLARELAANTDEHPNVIALRHRVARFEQMVAEERTRPKAPSSEIDRMLASDRWELAQRRTQLADTEKTIAILNGRIDRTPQVTEELGALEQVESVLTEKYLGSLRKVEEAELAESLESAQQGSQISMLDPAQIPAAPKRPRWMMLVGGLAATLGLMLGLAVLLELVDPVVVGAGQLERLAERPVLGSLPRVA